MEEYYWPPPRLQQEIRQMESAIFQLRREKQVIDSVDKKDLRKKESMKRELKAVRSGEKKRPFFLRRSALKREEEGQRYDELLTQGGKTQVDRFIEKKRKKQLHRA